MQLKNLKEYRERRHRRLRQKISGTAARPRMALCVSNSNLYVQFVDDETGKTLASASSLPLKAKLNVETAAKVGKAAAEAAKAAGISLVVVDRGLTEPVQTLEVVGDNPGFGRVSGEQLVKAIGGKGKVALMQGVLCQVNTDRVEAFKKVLADYPEIELLEEGVSDWSTEKGLRLMENYLQKHPQLDAVWAGDDDVLLGAKKAYEESGRTDLRILLGGGGSKAVVKMILDGDPLVTQTVTYPPKMIYVAAQEAAKLLAGETPAEARIVVPAEVIDASNAAANYFPDSAY